MAIGTVIREINLGVNDLWGMCFDGKSIWIADPSNSRIFQVDPVTGAIGRVISQSTIRGLTFDGKRFIAADIGANVTRWLYPDSGKTETMFAEVDTQTNGLSYDGRNLWCACTAGNTIKHVTLGGQVLKSFASQCTLATGIAFDGRHLWVNDYSGNKIRRLDTDGRLLQTENPPGNNPSSLCWDGRTLWIFSYAADRLYQVMVN